MPNLTKAKFALPFLMSSLLITAFSEQGQTSADPLCCGKEGERDTAVIARDTSWRSLHSFADGKVDLTHTELNNHLVDIEAFPRAWVIHKPDFLNRLMRRSIDLMDSNKVFVIVQHGFDPLQPYDFKNSGGEGTTGKPLIRYAVAKVLQQDHTQEEIKKLTDIITKMFGSIKSSSVIDTIVQSSQSLRDLVEKDFEALRVHYQHVKTENRQQITELKDALLHQAKDLKGEEFDKWFKEMFSRAQAPQRAQFLQQQIQQHEDRAPRAAAASQHSRPRHEDNMNGYVSVEWR